MCFSFVCLCWYMWQREAWQEQVVLMCRIVTRRWHETLHSLLWRHLGMSKIMPLPCPTSFIPISCLTRWHSIPYLLCMFKYVLKLLPLHVLPPSSLYPAWHGDIPFLTFCVFWGCSPTSTLSYSPSLIPLSSILADTGTFIPYFLCLLRMSTNFYSSMFSLFHPSYLHPGWHGDILYLICCFSVSIHVPPPSSFHPIHTYTRTHTLRTRDAV